MNHRSRSAISRGVPLLSLLLFLAACGGSGAEAGAAEAGEEPEAEATETAAATGGVAETEEEPTPEEPTPAEPATLTVEAGTELSAVLDDTLSTKRNEVGDTFTARLSDPVAVGRTVAIPEGARLEGEVTAVQKRGKAGEEAFLKIHVTRLSFDGESYPIAATVTRVDPEKDSRSGKAETAGKIGGGALGGAILGKVLGDGKKATAIGAAAGAAAGTAIHLGTKDVDAVLPAGSPLGLRLEEALVVKAPS